MVSSPELFFFCQCMHHVPGFLATPIFSPVLCHHFPSSSIRHTPHPYRKAAPSRNRNPETLQHGSYTLSGHTLDKEHPNPCLAFSPSSHLLGSFTSHSPSYQSSPPPPKKVPHPFHAPAISLVGLTYGYFPCKAIRNLSCKISALVKLHCSSKYASFHL